MRNYSFNVNSLLSKIIPSYLNGRNFHMFMRALFYPIQSLIDNLAARMNELILDANMTSQIILLEWYLNKKFKTYFINQSDKIVINSYTTEVESTPELYRESYVATHPSVAPVLYSYSSKLNKCLYRDRMGKYSFFVRLPKHNSNISETDYVNMTKYIVEKYRLASKSFQIIINS